MSFLFDRYASLTIGLPGEEGILFDGFRISWDIEKTSESNPNTCKVKIWNLNETSRSALEQKGVVMILEVGYNSIPERVGGRIVRDQIKEILFSGDIKKVSTVKNGPDRITTLEGGDGEVALQDKNINKSFGPNTPITSVFNQLIDKLGVAKGTVKGIKDESFQNGLALTGLVKDQLDTLTKKQDLEWSIQDNEVQILPKDTSIDGLAIQLTAETGLVGTPIKREEGLEFTALLNPQIRPGRKVEIISRDIDGIFIVKKAKYKGDNREGQNIIQVEAI